MKAMARRVPVLMYHDVIESRTREAQWFDCTTEEFEQQMARIVELGLTPITLEQLYNHLTNGAEIPENSIVLTFDDNYQGFFDRALPILEKYQFPAAVFVHTGFVGNKEGFHPKMDWPTLKELVKNPLITIGSHTVTHPNDITTLDLATQEKEVRDAKATLEKELGKPMDYFAYPNGMNNEVVQSIVRSAGHKMAFSIANGLAEESPNIVCVNRYVHTKLEDAVKARETALKGGALGIFQSPIKEAPVSYREVEAEGVKLGLITGGMPTSVMSETREGVRDFVKRTNAVAGINGGFFAMAAIKSTDNRMVGPSKTADMPQVLGDEETFRWPKLRNRPLVMWGKTGVAILPFQPESMRTPEVFANYMPDMTDTFLAGVWLVHGGLPREREDMNTFASKDIQDARKRAFLGFMPDGTPVLGASLQSTSSADLAKAAAASGIAEAVLLDSGFSTSLVYGDSIKAYGHSTPTNPSRPVPHAIVLKGTLDPATAALAKDTGPKQDEERPRRKRRRRR